MTGIEPATSGTTTQSSTTELQPPYWIYRLQINLVELSIIHRFNLLKFLHFLTKNLNYLNILLKLLLIKYWFNCL